MTGRDHYYNKSKQEGYRSRSAYKLKQLDREVGLLPDGGTVVDLGAAPGGWLQVAAEAVGPSGRVIGVDRQRISDLDDHEVETIRGDMTEDDTKERVREVAGGTVDTVVSDLAPNMTGEYSVDHARSVHLARQALETALDLLGAGGDFAVKVFDGQDFDAFREDVAASFEYVRVLRPDASRDSSSEVYVVGKRRLTTELREGDELDVEITDIGDEGDGIASVDGYTLFVPGTDPGEELTVRVTDVKPRFGFAEPLDG
ncbi:RlmE family RNA methyltransferase [Halanaeroarchaeum sulfurireducens]|uniref:Ribosomal RNA large subunit methyltransferase E n=1 Tax=Halanaeroarchaeum sulfurireducens TaxID=1604004 RepID=A0A0N9N7C9_9EURY|nr:23S rRNA (uridine(2552)-2'-O)-methyltransferase [Halanaeroarchaeum sulfurireducens]ALG82970.1 23S rRNA methyltransferase J [Halanaeroarchaeum sulfurireducens]